MNRFVITQGLITVLFALMAGGWLQDGNLWGWPMLVAALIQAAAAGRALNS